jgi:hypothetical protein
MPSVGLTWLRVLSRWHPEADLEIPWSIAFAFVATHNHFVLDRGGKVFKQSAPVIKLPAEATEDDHLALLGILNSSTACFWLKQNSYPKGHPAATPVLVFRSDPGQTATSSPARPCRTSRSPRRCPSLAGA